MYTTNADDKMGCLADIHTMFDEDDDLQSIDVEMYSGGHPGNLSQHPDYPNSGPRDWFSALMREVCTRAAQYLPAGVFINAVGRDETMRTGMVTMRRNSHPAVIHSRIAPFRIFIERPDRVEFFNMAEEYGGMGAFIACHMYGRDNVASLISPTTVWSKKPGHHQSMFCHMYSTPSGMICPYAVRRVAALHPSLRHHLMTGEDESDDPYVVCNLEDGFSIPPLKESAFAKAEAALIKAGFNRIPVPNPNMDMKATVQHFQLWHDTIVAALSK